MSGKRIAMALVIVGVLAFMGAMLGELYPLTGGPLAQIAEPFSPIRNREAGLHAIVGGIIGLILSMLGKDKPKENTSDGNAGAKQ